jgi:hypothetical protein
MNNDKHLQFIAEHLEEWPSDQEYKVSVGVYGQIMFSSKQNGVYTIYYSSQSKVFEEPSQWYAREQWQEARNELLAEYVPEVGDVVDIEYVSNNHTLENCTINYISTESIVYVFNGDEHQEKRCNVTITPHKPEPTPQDLMLEDWRSFNSLDEAYDNMMSTARIGDVFDALVKAGWTKGK